MAMIPPVRNPHRSFCPIPPPKPAADQTRSHREFHLALEDAAGNPYLELVVNPLRQQTELMFSVLLERRGGISWEEHEEICDAIRSGDPDLARTRMRDHIANAISAFELTDVPPRRSAEEATAR